MTTISSAHQWNVLQIIHYVSNTCDCRKDRDMCNGTVKELQIYIYHAQLTSETKPISCSLQLIQSMHQLDIILIFSNFKAFFICVSDSIPLSFTSMHASPGDMCARWHRHPHAVRGAQTTIYVIVLDRSARSLCYAALSWIPSESKHPSINLVSSIWR